MGWGTKPLALVGQVALNDLRVDAKIASTMPAFRSSGLLCAFLTDSPSSIAPLTLLFAVLAPRGSMLLRSRTSITADQGEQQQCAEERAHADG
ncbi:hypothetical protein [Nonomuraea guangzhouensis]|uniref:Uncharacterized protein n=1 Tax=Nonomuraea guangzhouensis TaxID=1291555 RepID=A0ABW4GD72_9ACTN|nr:hypothetical protein [Nonomuraea guangzhouensis]